MTNSQVPSGCLRTTSVLRPRVASSAPIPAGGSISHHHGIGKLRRRFVDKVASPDSLDAVRALKQGVDPQNVFGVRNNIFAG